jgi:hypothetical protein
LQLGSFSLKGKAEVRLGGSMFFFSGTQGEGRNAQLIDVYPVYLQSSWDGHYSPQFIDEGANGSERVISCPKSHSNYIKEPRWGGIQTQASKIPWHQMGSPKAPGDLSQFSLIIQETFNPLIIHLIRNWLTPATEKRETKGPPQASSSTRPASWQCLQIPLLCGSWSAHGLWEGFTDTPAFVISEHPTSRSPTLNLFSL